MATLHEAKFMGYSINFKTKSGRSNSDPVLIAVGNHEVLIKKGNRGDLQKKKRSTHIRQHILRHLRAENCTIPAAKQVLTFFFFLLEITPHVIMTCLTDIKV